MRFSARGPVDCNHSEVSNEEKVWGGVCVCVCVGGGGVWGVCVCVIACDIIEQ